MWTLAQIARLAMSFPDVTESERRGNRAWNRGSTCFAWERPFTKADLKRFGDEPVPASEILGVRVADLHEKEALLANPPKGFFTIPHFDGWPAVLIQLSQAGQKPVREALLDAYRWAGG
jgi:hypothetical protein